jgi:hypothetical protein
MQKFTILAALSAITALSSCKYLQQSYPLEGTYTHYDTTEVLTRADTFEIVAIDSTVDRAFHITRRLGVDYRKEDRQDTYLVKSFTGVAKPDEDVILVTGTEWRWRIDRKQGTFISGKNVYHRQK